MEEIAGAEAKLDTAIVSKVEHLELESNDLKIYAFGSAECDQFYIENTTSFESRRPVPVILSEGGVSLAHKVSDVACGAMHTLLLLSSGEVYSMGNEDDGVLGRTGEPNRPMRVPLPVPVDMIAAGEKHSIFVNSKSRRFFFTGSYRTQDESLTQKYESPIELDVELPNDQPFTKIMSGLNHTVLQVGSTLYAWGDPERGKLGRVPAIRHRKKEAFKVNRVGLKRVVDFWAGGNVTFAKCTKRSGEFEYYSWGSNWCAQLGLGDVENRETPQAIEELEGLDIVKIASGSEHSVAITRTGETFSWGNNTYGFCGVGTELKLVPSPMKVKLEHITDVACGENYSYALQEVEGRQSVFSWGMGSNYVLLTGNEEDISEPHQVSRKVLKEEWVVKIVAGSMHVVYLARAKAGKTAALEERTFESSPTKVRRSSKGTVERKVLFKMRL